jgi:hypothetical protein
MTRKEHPDLKNVFITCTACDKRKGEIHIRGYAERMADLCLCLNCATQLARKLLEDLSVYTPGGRHG